MSSRMDPILQRRKRNSLGRVIVCSGPEDQKPCHSPLHGLGSFGGWNAVAQASSRSLVTEYWTMGCSVTASERSPDTLAGRPPRRGSWSQDWRWLCPAHWQRHSSFLLLPSRHTADQGRCWCRPCASSWGTCQGLALGLPSRLHPEQHPSFSWGVTRELPPYLPLSPVSPPGLLLPVLWGPPQAHTAPTFPGTPRSLLVPFLPICIFSQSPPSPTFLDNLADLLLCFTHLHRVSAIVHPLCS